MATPHEVHKIISSLLSKKSDIRDVSIFIYTFLNDQICNIICKENIKTKMVVVINPRTEDKSGINAALLGPPGTGKAAQVSYKIIFVYRSYSEKSARI